MFRHRYRVLAGMFTNLTPATLTPATLTLLERERTSKGGRSAELELGERAAYKPRKGYSRALKDTYAFSQCPARHPEVPHSSCSPAL